MSKLDKLLEAAKQGKTLSTRDLDAATESVIKVNKGLDPAGLTKQMEGAQRIRDTLDIQPVRKNSNEGQKRSGETRDEYDSRVRKRNEEKATVQDIQPVAGGSYRIPGSQTISFFDLVGGKNGSSSEQKQEETPRKGIPTQGIQPVAGGSYIIPGSEYKTGQQISQEYKTKRNTKAYEKNFGDGLTGAWKSNKALGRITQDVNAAYSAYLANPTKANLEYAKKLEKLADDFQIRHKDALDEEGTVALWVKDLASYLPQFADQLKAQVAGGAAGAAAGSVVPGVGTVLGAKAGIVTATGIQSYNQMRGAAFRELLAAGIDEETARTACQDEAVISALIEMADTVFDLATLGTGAAITKILGKETVEKVAKTGAATSLKKFASAIGKYTNKWPVAYALNIAGEGLEEGSQQAVSIANRDRAKNGDTGIGNLAGKAIGTAADAFTGKNDDAKAEIIDAAKTGMRIAAVSGGVTKAGSVVTSKAAEAHRNKVVGEAEAGISNYDIVQEGLGFAEGTEPRRMADALSRKLDAPGDESVESVTASEYGALRISIEQAKAAGLTSTYNPQQTPTSAQRTPNTNTEQQTRAAEKVRSTVQQTAAAEQAAAPEQAAAVQEQAEANGGRVTPSATYSFMAAGDMASVADRKARVLERMRNGESVSNTNLRNLDIGSASTRAVIEAMAGMKVPMTNDTQTLLQFGRELEAHFAIERAQQEAAQAEAAAMEAQITQVEQELQERAAQAEQIVRAHEAQRAAEIQETADAQAADVVAQISAEADRMAREAETSAQATSQPGGGDTVRLSDGTRVTQQEFISRYLAANPGKTEVDAHRCFVDAKIRNDLGDAYPADGLAKTGSAESVDRGRYPNLDKVVNGESGSQKTDVSDVFKPASQNTESRQQENAGAEKRHSVDKSASQKQSGSEAAKSPANGKATDAQRWTVDHLNNVLSKREGAPKVVLDFDFTDGSSGYYDADTNTIHLNGSKLTTQQQLTYTLSHELVHSVHDAKARHDLTDTLLTFGNSLYGVGGMAEKTAETWDTYVAFYTKKKGLSLEEAKSKLANEDDGYFFKEELAANIMRDVLTKPDVMRTFAQEQPTPAQWLRDKANDIVNDLIKRVTKADETTWDIIKQARKIADTLGEGISEAEKKKTDAEPTERAESAPARENVPVGEEGASYEVDGKRHSIRSLTHDVAEGKMFDDLVSAGVFTKEEAGLLKENLTKLIEYMVPNASILDMNEAYDKGNRPFSAYKPNSDPLYKISLDFSTLCRKRLMTQYVIEQLQLRENRPMSAEEQIAIRSMLIDYRENEKALQVACAMCYVEAARLKSPKQMEAWFNNTEALMRKYFSKKNGDYAADVKKAQEQFKIDHGYAANAPKKAMSQADRKAMDAMSLEMRKAYAPTAEQQAIIDAAVKLPRSTFLTAANLTALSVNHPEIYEAYTEHIRASTRSKSLEGDVPYYYGDSKGPVRDKFIEGVNAENGMRFDSWSDFQMKHMLDMITAVIDLSVRGAKMHGYTKFPEMVRIFGKTGMQFNLSGVTEGIGLDENGKLIFSATESINKDEAIKLREDFPETAGLQCIGVNEAHIRALLRSDIIDYVIPYHTSGMNATLRKMAGIYNWQDYTSTQHATKDPGVKKPAGAEKWQVEPVWSEFYVAEGKDGYDIMQKTAQRYIDMCHERGLIPKFNEFTNEDGYWKLLVDRKMINQKTGAIIEQQPVKPIFDFDLIRQEIDREVKQYDPQLEQRALKHVVDNFDAVHQRIDDLKKNGPKKSMATLGNEVLQAYAEGSKRHSVDDIASDAEGVYTGSNNYTEENRYGQESRSERVPDYRGKSADVAQAASRETGMGDSADRRRESEHNRQSESDNSRALRDLISGVPELAEMLGIKIDRSRVTRKEAQLLMSGLPAEDSKEAKSAHQRALYSRSLATMTDDRLKRVYAEYSYPTVPTRTKAYLAYISPYDFLDLTTANVSSFLEENPEGLNGGENRQWGGKNQILGSGLMYLRIDGDGNVIGHEGRHRMAALHRAGVERVAISIVFNETVDNAKPIKIMGLSGQRTSGIGSYGSAYIHHALPVSKEYETINRYVFGDVSEDNYFANPNIRFSVTPEMDKAYMGAVESGDIETVQRMVDEAAKDAGYPQKLYHGTPLFGFTKFDLSRMFDQRSIFVTSDVNMAASYGGSSAKLREIVEGGVDIDALDDKGLLSYAEKMYGEKGVEIASDSLVDFALGEATEYLEEDAADLEQVLSDIGALDDSRTHQIAERIIDSVSRMASGTTIEDTRRAYDDYVSAVAALNREDPDIASLFEQRTPSSTSEIGQWKTKMLTGGTFFYLKDVDSLATADDIRDALRGNVGDSGIYSLYGKTDNLMEVDAGGQSWNRIDGAQIGESGLVTTLEISRAAQEQGRDGVIIRNVVDYGGDTPNRRLPPRDVYVYFDESSLKSADPVTYDDAGDVIPLSERFNDQEKDLRYSVDSSMPFKGQVNTALRETTEKNRYNALYIRETPNLLAEVGLGDLPLCITAKHVKDIVHEEDPAHKEWHGIPIGMAKRIPELLSKPVMILDSETKPGDVVVVTSEVDRKHRPVLITINPNGEATVDGERGPANFITSMYGRNGFDTWLDYQAEAGRVLFWDKKRSDQLFNSAGISCPGRLKAIASDEIIREHSGYVKENIPKRRFSVDGDSGADINPDTGYERGSLEDSAMRIYNVKGRDAAVQVLQDYLDAINKIAEEHNKKVRDGKAAEVLNPKLTQERIESNSRKIEALIKKFGEMEQTSGAQQEVHLPKKIDPNTKVRGAVQTEMAHAATTEPIANQLVADILAGKAGVTYTPITDNGVLKNIRKQIKSREGFEEIRSEWNDLIKSGKLPSKQDIAKGEALYVQACAEKRVAEAVQIAAEIAVMGTKAGQAVQAFSLLKRMSPTGKAYYIKRTVDSLNRDKLLDKKGIKLTLDKAMVEKLLTAKTAEEVKSAEDTIIDDLAKQIPATFADKVNLWRYTAMLTNPRTHIRNIFGNMLFAPLRKTKNSLATLMEHMFIKDESQRTKSVVVSKEWRDFAKQDAELMKEELQGGGRYELKDRILDKRQTFGNADLAKTAPGKLGANTIGKAIEKTAKTNTALMEKEDWGSRVPLVSWAVDKIAPGTDLRLPGLRSAYVSALGGFLQARGFTVDQVYGENSTPEGRAALDVARTYALKEAQKATYRDASRVAGVLGYVNKNLGGVGKVLMGGVLPFTKTPINIARRAIEYSPVGILKSVTTDLYKLSKNEMSAAEVIDDLCAGLTGTGVFLMGYFLAKAGVLIGGLGDDEEDKFKELQGYQDYSFNWDDKNYTIDWASPVAMPLFVGAEWHKLMQQRGHDLSFWDWADASLGLLDPLLAMSMMSGLNDTLSAVSYNRDAEPIPAIVEAIVASYMGQFVPSALGALARTIDDSRRTNFTPTGQKGLEKQINIWYQTNILGKTPFLSDERMLYIDEWGRTDTDGGIVMRGIANFLSPGYYNTIRTSPLEEELSRLAKSANDKSVFPSKAQKSFKVDKETYAMTQDEYQAHLIECGQTSYRLVSDLIHSPGYERLSEAEKAAAINLAYTYAAETAKYHTNEGYARNKWQFDMDDYVAKGGDAAEYLMLETRQSQIKKDTNKDVKLGTLAMRDDRYTAADVANLLMAEETIESSFPDPKKAKHEYTMNAEQQKKYSEILLRNIDACYAEIQKRKDLQNLSDIELDTIVRDELKAARQAAKEEMAKWLKKQGVKSTKKNS